MLYTVTYEGEEVHLLLNAAAQFENYQKLFFADRSQCVS
ncbi:hypothetical protein DSUL_20207 [Desulfovibrionales bacterium]